MEDECKSFYKLVSKETDDMGYIHFTTGGQVAFKSVLFLPMSDPHTLFDEYGSRKSSYIKLCIAEHSSQMTSMM